MTRDFFDRLNDWIRETESSIVNFLSAFAPWMAPLAPAYMTFQHAQNSLDFPIFIAAPVAILVEILGFSAVSTFMAFWFFNRKNRADAKKAPIGLVILAFMFYLLLIIFSNVLLDTFPGQEWALIVVRALYTMQTIPAALIVAVRVQHRDLLNEYAKDLEVKRSHEPRHRSAIVQAVQVNVHERSGERPHEHEQDIYDALTQVWNSEHRIAGPTEIARMVNLDPYRSKGYISEKTKVWRIQFVDVIEANQE